MTERGSASAQDVSPLGFTGERVLPDDPEWAWCFQAHKFGYDDLARRIAPGQRVLDIGCGEGYGADVLAGTDARVTACDYSYEAVSHARSRYARAAVDWLVCDAQRLPFRDNAFDVVSSLQVIEHFRDTDSHLAGVARVLRDGGWHYCATPNIDKMSDAEKDNPYHVRDFTAPDLRATLGRFFGVVELFGMFYDERSARVRTMLSAERTETRDKARIERVEARLAKLPGPLRTRLRGVARMLAGAPRTTADEARQAIMAEDFVPGTPAEDSFCLIAVAREPRR